MTNIPEIVSAGKWQQDRDELLKAEKEATRALDALAARRRRLPMVRFDNNKYVFGTPAGPATLLDLFGRQPQLAVYQFMDNGPDDYCGAGDGFMLSVFLRDGQDIYRTYCTTARGVDRLLFVNNILDLAPYGRQEDWED